MRAAHLHPQAPHQAHPQAPHQAPAHQAPHQVAQAALHQAHHPAQAHRQALRNLARHGISPHGEIQHLPKPGLLTLLHNGVLNNGTPILTPGDILLQPGKSLAMAGTILLTVVLLNPSPSLTPGIQTNGGEPKLEAAAHLPHHLQAHLQAPLAPHQAAPQAALQAAHHQAHHPAQVHHPAQAQRNWLKIGKILTLLLILLSQDHLPLLLPLIIIGEKE